MNAKSDATVPDLASMENAALEAVRRRLGLADPTVYLEEARLRIEGEQPPDWVVLLTGAPLPGTMRHWVRVQLSGSPEPWGTVDTRSVPSWFCSDSNTVDSLWGPIRGMVIHTEDLDEAHCLDVMRLLESASGDDLTRVTEDRPVIDGYQCDLTVLRRNPWRVTRACFNLSSISARMQGQPAVKIARAIGKLRATIQAPAPKPREELG